MLQALPLSGHFESISKYTSRESKRSILKLSIVVFGMSVLILTFGVRLSYADDADFYTQCNLFLPIADDFSAECLQKARPFQRTFHPSGGSRGEVESFSAYFKPLETPSRFLLGCVLNFKHQLSFVGIYYSHDKIDMKSFDQYPISFIDFYGNVGVKIGNKQLTLIAIRQFGTDKIPLQIQGERSNCENASLEFMNGEIPSYYGMRYKYIGNDVLQQIPHSGGEYPNEKVKMYFGVHRRPLVFAQFMNSLFIDSDGVLMVGVHACPAEQCVRQKQDVSNAYNLCYEMCSVAQSVQ